MKHQPYTYLIGWSWLDTWYYGCRYNKNCCPSDLWNPYKTSSVYVKAFILEHGEPDVIEVRKIFKTRKESRIWEYKVIKRLGIVRSKRWLNKGNGGKEFYVSEETIIKMKKPHGPMSEEHKLKLRGPHSEEHKTKMRGPRGSFTEEHKTKMRGPRGSWSEERKTKYIPWNKGIKCPKISEGRIKQLQKKKEIK